MICICVFPLLSSPCCQVRYSLSPQLSNAIAFDCRLCYTDTWQLAAAYLSSTEILIGWDLKMLSLYVKGRLRACYMERIVLLKKKMGLYFYT